MLRILVLAILVLRGCAGQRVNVLISIKDSVFFFLVDNFVHGVSYVDHYIHQLVANDNIHSFA